MKTNRQIASLALIGLVCLNICSVVAKNPIKKSAHRKYRFDKSLPTKLAGTKIKNIEFGFASEEVSPGYYPALDRVVKLMASNNASITVSGHADNKGAYVYNWKLSERRAKAVKNYLARKGADTSRIATTEFGDTRPIAPNKTVAGRQRNRRAEIHFVD